MADTFEAVTTEAQAVDGQTYDMIDGRQVCYLGEPVRRVIIAVFPGDTLEYTRIYEMAAFCTVPEGYRIYQVSLPFDRETVTEAQVDEARQIIRQVYDHVQSLKSEHIYLMAYDMASEIGMEALEGLSLDRTYLISPVFRIPGKRKLKRWRIQTEILYGIQDTEVTAKELRHFEKNSTSHVTKITAGHHLTTDDHLLAIKEWLTGNRQMTYNNNPFTIAMMFGVLAGYLFGSAFLNNFGIGILIGIVLGMGGYHIYCRF